MSPQTAEARIEAHSAKLETASVFLEEKVAQLSTKGFWIGQTAMQIVVVSGVILLSDKLRALFGL